MDTLLYLFNVATQPVRPEGGIARWPVVVWTYRSAFNALVLWPDATLTFKDVDAWVEHGGRTTWRTAFVGDCQDMAERMTAMDRALAEILRPRKTSRAGDTYAVTNPRGVTDRDLADLSQRIADARIPSGVDLCAAEHAVRVRAVLDAWISAGPFVRPFADIEIGTRRGLTMTI